MLRNLTRAVAGLFLLSPFLAACGVPQFDPDAKLAALTVEQLLAGGHYRRALALLTAEPEDASKAEKPPAETAHQQFQLSRVELGFGHLEGALQLAEKAVTADPENAAYHVQLAAVAGRSAEHAGMFKQLGFAKRAKKELELALSIDTKNGDAIYGLMLFADLAPSFIGGDKARALKLADQLTEIDPARGYLAQAALAHNRKDYAKEETLLKSAVTAGAGSYEAHMAYARFVNSPVAVPPDQTRLDIADEQTCEALASDPGRADAWQLLAQLAAAAECWPEVEGLLATARKFDPDDLSPAYFAAATMTGAGKNLDTAQTLLNQYLASPLEGDTPSEGRARYQLALILEKKGDNDQALDLMRMALAEDPTLDEAKKEVKRLEHAPAEAPAPRLAQ